MRASSWVKLIVILAVAAAVVGFYRHYTGKEAAPTYETEKLDRGEIDQTISATGTCNAVVTVEVGSQVSGNIAKINADFNSEVHKGDVIAEIEPDTFEARVKQNQASLDVAQAAVVNAQASLRRADADIANSQANLAAQKANLVRAQLTAQDAKSKLDHTQQLFERGMVSSEERDTAETTYKTNQAQVEAAQAQVDAAESSVKASMAGRDVAETQLSSAQAQKRQVQFSLDQSKIDLDHTKILAPVDGTVISRQMDVGQTVAASFSAPTIFEIAEDLTKMQVEANVDEADIGLVKVGQPTAFTVDAYPDLIFPGEVQQIRKQPNTESNVVTYDVVIGVHNKDLKLLPGMTANVKILVNKRENALRLPDAALRVRLDLNKDKTDAAGPGAGTPPAGERGPRGGNGPTSGTMHRGGEPGFASGVEEAAAPEIRTIYVLGADGTPRQVRVRLGISDGYYTEIVKVLGGELSEGDAIIIGTTDATGALVSQAANGNRGGRRGRRGFPF